MSQKDLKPQLKPQLARHYELATKEVFGTTVIVPKKHYAKFLKRERELSKTGVFPLDYARGVCKHLKRWVRSKGWKRIQVNIFLGPWAESLYRKEIGNRQFERIAPDSEKFQMLVMESYKVLNYAHHTPCEFDAAAAELWLAMSESWKRRYKSGSISTAVDAATQLFVSGHGDING